MATKKTKKKVQFWGTGRRKKAIARVRLIPEGSGVITINKRSIDEYFGLDTLKQIVRQPLELTENLAKYDVIVNVQGGGFTGQAGAIRHGISRALVLADETTKAALKKAGFLTRDPRAKPQSKGKKEVRSQESKTRTSVQQEIIGLPSKFTNCKYLTRGTCFFYACARK